METAEWHRYVNTSNILKYSRMADAMTGTKGIYEKARRDQNGAIIVQTMNQSEPIIWAILRAQNYVKK